MKLAFFNESGKNVNSMSDIELRFKAAASEIYSAWANADFVLKQAFVQTASGKYLDMHAELRGIARKQSSKARGTLSFYVSEPLESDIIIPANTICSAKGRPQIQFSTQSEAVLNAGELTCTVEAEALNDGRESNAGAGEVTVMVNPPEFVVGVTNENAFTGGSSAESDSSLRERIVSSYNVLSNAVNKKSVEELIMTLDGVLDCNLSLDAEGTLIACVKTRDNEVLQELTQSIINLMGFASLCGVAVSTVAASRVDFSVFAAVKLKPGYSKETLEAQISEKISEVCSGEKIGKSIRASEITSALYEVQGAELSEVSFTPGAEGVVPCGAQEYLVLNGVQVQIYE